MQGDTTTGAPPEATSLGLKRDWTEPQKRQLSWQIRTTEQHQFGRKGSYAGLPMAKVTKATRKLPEDEQITDYSALVGAQKAISRRRAKNRVARASRRVNRG